MNRRKKAHLKLYVIGETLASKTALSNLRAICDSKLDGRYTIEVIDLQKRPELAELDKIIATPTLIRQLPEPVRMIIGDLSKSDTLLLGLGLHEEG